METNKRTVHSIMSDRHLVDGSDTNEVEKVVTKMHKEGYKDVHAADVRRLIKEYGNSRRRLYALIRESFEKAVPEETPYEPFDNEPVNWNGNESL